VEFNCNCSFTEAFQHSPFEMMYEFQPSTYTYRLQPLTGATADTTDRLILVSYIRDVVKQLLQLSKERMTARSIKTAPLFQPGDLVYLTIKG